MQPTVNPSHDVRGLALLLRKGMAAWMLALSQPCGTGPTVAKPRGDEAPSNRMDATVLTDRRMAGVEQMLVNILAAMTQATALAMEV